jgi:hypothetical protein
MATATGLSVEEYLNTEYEPDRDYVDRELEDRNVGRRDHSYPQAAFPLRRDPRRTDPKSLFGEDMGAELPRGRHGWVCTGVESREAIDGVLRTADPEITVSLADVLP